MAGDTAAEQQVHTAQEPLTHLALMYRGVEDDVQSIISFVRAGLDAGQPALIAVPAANATVLAEALGQDAGRVMFADMTDVGRNPAWIIPRVREFIDQNDGRPVRYVGEPVWRTRTQAEIREATRHEALINLAFAGSRSPSYAPTTRQPWTQP